MKNVLRLAAPKKGFKREPKLREGDFFTVCAQGVEVRAHLTEVKFFKRPENKGGRFFIFYANEISRKEKSK